MLQFPDPFFRHVTIWMCVSVLALIVVNLLLALFSQLLPSPPVLILPPSSVSLSSNFSGITSHTSHLFWCWLFLLRLSLHLPPPSLFLSSPLLRHAHLISVSTWVLLRILSLLLLTPPTPTSSSLTLFGDALFDGISTTLSGWVLHKLTKHWIKHYAEYDCCVMWFGSWNKWSLSWQLDMMLENAVSMVEFKSI